MSNNMLLVDCCSDFSEITLDLNESSKDGDRVKFRGKLQEAEAENKNKRVYPFDVLDENVKRLKSLVEDRRLVGELDHPTDSIIHFANASHVITKIWWEGNMLMGEGEILNTPHGKVLKALINDGVKIGMSSRGVGNGKTNENGTLVISDGYKLITFDAVADPSTFKAFQEKVTDKKESVVSHKVDNYANTATKNESCGVNKVSKDLVLACLGSIVKSKTNEIKREI
jgi:hypothetical protein